MVKNQKRFPHDSDRESKRVNIMNIPRECSITKFYFPWKMILPEPYPSWRGMLLLITLSRPPVTPKGEGRSYPTEKALVKGTAQRHSPTKTLGCHHKIIELSSPPT